MVAHLTDASFPAQILVALMKKLRLPHQCASNGLEALNAYSATPADFFLVLMDIDMPVMNGNLATVKIREFERRHKSRRTCVVALTGVTNKESRKECLASGMDRFYTKPIRMKELSAMIDEVREQLP